MDFQASPRRGAEADFEALLELLSTRDIIMLSLCRYPYVTGNERKKRRNMYQLKHLGLSMFVNDVDTIRLLMHETGIVGFLPN